MAPARTTRGAADAHDAGRGGPIMSIRWFGYGRLPLQELCVGCRRHQTCIMSSIWLSRGQQGTQLMLMMLAAGARIMSIRWFGCA